MLDRIMTRILLERTSGAGLRVRVHHLKRSRLAVR